MANMKTVNQLIKKNYPQHDIKAYRGEGYVYFVCGFNEIESIYINPVTADTDKLANMVVEHLQDYLSQ